MKTPRLRLNHGMGLVLLVAVDFAMIRGSRLLSGGAADLFWLQSIVLTALPTANLAALAFLLRDIQSGPGRFLKGFAIGSATTSALFVVACFDAELIQPPMGMIGRWLVELLNGRGNPLDFRTLILFNTTFSSLIALPQVVLASTCGLIAVRLGRSRAIPADQSSPRE